MLHWRSILTFRAIWRNSSALLGIVLALAVLGPAAMAAGQDARTALPGMASAESASYLNRFFLTVQGLWLLLLLPGSVLAVRQAVPVRVLRRFPVRPFSLALAGTLGALLDIPTLLALFPLFGTVQGAERSLASWGIATAAVGLLALQTTATAHLLEQAGALLGRHRRVATLVAGVLLLALVSPLISGKPAQASPVRPSSEPLAQQNLLPAGVTATALSRAAQGNLLSGMAALALLSFYTGATMALTTGISGRLLRQSAGISVGNARNAGSGVSILPTRREDRAVRRRRATLWEQVFVAARTELRCLTRNPAAHLPLRQPATLLLVLAYAWIAPNLGGNIGKNTRDLLSMAALIYLALWQIQLLCNRFGNEAGTMPLLLSAPIPRWRLLFGKNLALFLLLLLVDSAMVALFCQAAEKPAWVLPALGGLPPVVLALTTCGNILSVAIPFPIRQSESGRKTEPPSLLSFGYVLVGGTVGMLTTGLYRAWDIAPVWGIAGTLVGIGLYAASLHFAGEQLTQNEPRMIRQLTP
ncbi:MAG: hypothetical protein OHK0029_38410 [Armatimonadaceae bacterium]